LRISPGTRLGPYEITAKLGEGGMGEVYRATDSHLKREVAIKVLPAAFTEDKERLARFEREAQLLAQLNHPNIAQIYGLEASGDQRALVMELVAGPTLADRLESGPLSLSESLSLALQLAQALEEAHEKGIVHRDLKPQNIKASSEGKAKVLDFGLAKAMDPAGAPSAAADLARSPTLMNSPTLTGVHGTQLGVILGTAAYMAPEQARGGAVDKRADIWAFGVVLYEMLTGKSLFAGPTVSDTLAGVLKTEIDWKTLPADTPAEIRHLLRRCLERNPKNRLHDIADARIVLDELLAGRTEGGEAPPAGAGSAAPHGASWPLKLAWLGGGLVLGALAIAGLGRSLFQAPPAAPPIVRSLTYSGKSGSASISADGRFVAFASGRDGTPRIWLKQLATGEEVALTTGRDFGPRISPDSGSVLFSRAEQGRLDLYRVPLVGGEPRRLARDVAQAAWSRDGKRIALARIVDRGSQLLLIPAEGGEEKLLLEQNTGLRELDWSPDGSSLLMLTAAQVNSISSTVLATVDLASGKSREIYRLPAGSVCSAARWDGDAAVLFAWSPSQAGRGEMLLQRLELGEKTPRPVFSFTSLPKQIELAGPGALLFDAGGIHQNLFEIGSATTPGGNLGRGLTGGPTRDRQPAFSPDGRRILFTSDRSGSLDLWSLELATGAVRRLTFDAADDWDPQWSPDGRHLLWSSNRGGHFEIWIAEPDGTGARQASADGRDAENPTMSRDGAWIVYSSSNPAAPGIWKVRPDGREATRLLAGAYTLPELAPQSGWVSAVETSPGNERTIRVVRIEDGATVAEVSVAGRRQNPGRSRWLPDGRTLVFYGDDESGRAAIFAQPIVPGRDTRSERRRVAVSDEQRVIESFGVSPVDGRIVVSAGWTDSDILLAEGIPGIGATLPKREP
jgi:Tol biopolymer transport system component